MEDSQVELYYPFSQYPTGYEPNTMAEDASLSGHASRGVEESKSIEGDFEGLEQYVDNAADAESGAMSVRSLQQETQRLAAEQRSIQAQLQTITDLLLKLSTNTTTPSRSGTTSDDDDIAAPQQKSTWPTSSPTTTRISIPANVATPTGLPLCSRDSKTAASVQKLCLNGIGMKFQGDSKQLLLFNSSLKMKCEELGLIEALFVPYKGVPIDLTKNWNKLSYKEVQQYELSLTQSTDAGDQELAQNQALLKLLLTYSLESTFKIGIVNVMESTDRGPSMLYQILHQSTGTLAVTIENYESIMKTTKLTDIDGCSFTKYYSDLKPIADNLFSWNHFPVRATATMIANTDGTENDAFNAVRLNALMDADLMTGANEQYDLWKGTAARLQAVYINQLQSGEWEQAVKKREAHALTTEIMAAFQKGKLSIKGGEKNKKDKNKKASNEKSSEKQIRSDWKKICPNSRETTEKVVDGKKYLWCGAKSDNGPCPSWGDHLRKDCPHKPYVPFTKKNKNDKKSNKEEKKEGMLALAAEVDDDSSDGSFASVEIKASYAFRE